MHSLENAKFAYPEISVMAVAFAFATFSQRLSPKHFSKMAANDSRVSIVLTRLQRTGGATDYNQLNYDQKFVAYPNYVITVLAKIPTSECYTFYGKVYRSLKHFFKYLTKQ